MMLNDSPNKEIIQKGFSTNNNNSVIGKYTGMRVSGEGKNQVTPESENPVKRVRDFKNPFQE